MIFLRRPSFTLVAVAWALLMPAAASGVILRPGDILFPDATNNAILRIDPVTGAQTVISSGGLVYNPKGIELEASGNILAIVEGPSSILGSVIRIDPATGAQTVVVSPGSHLEIGLALEASGDILIHTNQEIIRVDPVSGAQSVVSSGFSDLISVGVEPSGTILAGDNLTDALLRVDPVTGAQTMLAAIGFAAAIAVDFAGGIFVLDTPTLRVVHIDPTSGATTVVSTGFNVPFGLALEATGHILVGDVLAGLLRIDPATGSKTVVASGLGVAFDLAVVPDLVPEPSLALLLVSGLAGLATRGRRPWAARTSGWRRQNGESARAARSPPA